jgi:hypothetical protein
VTECSTFKGYAPLMQEPQLLMPDLHVHTCFASAWTRFLSWISKPFVWISCGRRCDVLDVCRKDVLSLPNHPATQRCRKDPLSQLGSIDQNANPVSLDRETSCATHQVCILVGMPYYAFRRLHKTYVSIYISTP